MLAADTLVLVLPWRCDQRASIRVGRRRRETYAILLEDPCTPDLMYMMVDRIATGLDDLLEWLAQARACSYPTNTPVLIELEAVTVDGSASQDPCGPLSHSGFCLDSARSSLLNCVSRCSTCSFLQLRPGRVGE